MFMVHTIGVGGFSPEQHRGKAFRFPCKLDSICLTVMADTIDVRL